MGSDTRPVTAETWLFPRVWGLFLLLLVVLTYPLWFFPNTETSYPGIPLWESLPPPGLFGIVPSIALSVSLATAIGFPNRCRWAWWIVAASLLTAFQLDQHRLQPWAYQSFLYALIFACMDEKEGRRFVIPLAASVYVYSAAGKLDYQFAHTVGQEFLQSIASPLGGLPDGISESWRARLALLLPGVELVAGLGLLLRPTRRGAAVILIAMHVSLITMLGPWGLDHSRGVLIWNVMLITQAFLVMLRRPTGVAPSSPHASTSAPTHPAPLVSSIQWAVRAVVVLAIAAPLFERSGYWDHWTSWSLYSPHTSRAEIELHRSIIGQLDPSIERYLLEDTDGDGWLRISLESWSLGQRYVPLYPQSRYQLALASHLAHRNDWESEVRVRLRGVADRWTGERSDARLLGTRQLDEALSEFWLGRPPN